MSDRPTLAPAPPPVASTPTGLGWNSGRVAQAHREIQARWTEATQSRPDPPFAEHAEPVHRILLSLGIDLYAEGAEYARKIDRWLIEAYLAILARRAGALPDVSFEELQRELHLIGADATASEIEPICRALGLPLSSR